MRAPMRDPMVTQYRRDQGLTINPVDAPHPENLDRKSFDAMLEVLFEDLAADSWARQQVKKMQAGLRHIEDLNDEGAFTDNLDTYELSEARMKLDMALEGSGDVRVVLLNLCDYSWELKSSDCCEDAVTFCYREEYLRRERALYQAKRNHEAGGWSDFEPWPLPDVRDFIWLGTVEAVTKYAGLDKHPYPPFVGDKVHAFWRNDWPVFFAKHAKSRAKGVRSYMWDSLYEAANALWKEQWGITEAGLYKLEETWTRPLSDFQWVCDRAVVEAKKMAKSKK